MSPRSSELAIRPYGREAILVELDGVAEMMALQSTLEELALPGVTDLMPGARTVLVRFSPSAITAAALAARVRQAAESPGDAARVAGGSPVVVPIVYDGPDLDHVANTCGLSTAEVVRRHLGGEYVVAFIGFAPGFYFLAGGDPALQMPRRESPRTKLPGGSVGLASEFTGIYPRESPGGWQIIGHTSAPLWDLTVHPSAMLAPGTRVRFEEVDS
jgi:KipI family sensor histidine kinase inhibitor